MAHSGYVWLQPRISGVLIVILAQEDRLWIADPKAISHILKNSGTLYKKLESTREMTAWILDNGLAWADGNTFSNSVPSRILIPTGAAHKRQRRAMTPAFGLVEAKGLLPYFAQSATKVGSRLTSVRYCDNQTFPQLTDKWHELIAGEGSGESSVMDMPSWLSKATLDAYVIAL